MFLNVNYTFTRDGQRRSPPKMAPEKMRAAPNSAPLRQRRFAAFVLLVLLTAPVFAETSVTVSNAWARATAPGQTVAGVYLSISSKFNARLVAVHCEVAKTAELHLMTMDGGMMRMRAVDSIALPAGATVRLSQGGYHIMLFDLKRGITAGEQIPLQLTVIDAEGKRSVVRARVRVRRLDAADPGGSR